MSEVPEQRGRRAIVTSANSGTGKEAAGALAAAGASVVIAVRTVAKGEFARRDILAKNASADLEVRQLDLADLDFVKAFADKLIEDGRPPDLLLNNAGVMTLPERAETVDGFEMQFGTNFLGPFALTLRLTPLLLDANAPRVVTMSRGSQAPIDFDNLDRERDYSAIGAYGRSKLADPLLSQELARIAVRRNLSLLSVRAHPGNSSTNIFENGTQLGGKQPLALRTAWRITPHHPAAAGAAPMVYGATAADVAQGDYVGPRFNLVGRPAKAKVSKRGKEEQGARRLWAEAERLTGVSVDGVLGSHEASK